MLNESKKRRLHIMEQISMRNNRRQTSQERRRRIQGDLESFVSTMSRVSYQPNSHKASEISQNANGQPATAISKQEESNLSPTFKNIEHAASELQLQKQVGQSNIPLQSQEIIEQQPLPYFKEQQMEHEVKAPISHQDVESTPAQNMEKDSGINEEVNEVADQEIRFPVVDLVTSQIPRMSQDQELEFRKEQKEGQSSEKNNSVSNNNSSAIFFTSQFHEFISKDKNSPNKQLEQEHGKPQQGVQKALLLKEEKGEDLKNMKEDVTERIHDSVASKQEEFVDHISENNSAEHSDKRKLLKNKSGHSIAYSNDSSLKYSLYESNIKEILSHKIHDQRSNVDEDGTLYNSLQFQIMADKLILNNLKQSVSCLKKFGELVTFCEKVRKRQLRELFDSFLIFREIVFEEKKNQIKAEKFNAELSQRNYEKIFKSLKDQCFLVPQQKLDRVQQFNQEKVKAWKQKIFRHLKISWYDKQVQREIDVYYLSKLFSHFKRAIIKSRNIDRKKYLNFYCKNMKRRFFNHLIEGIENHRVEQIQKENAEWHYVISLIGKCFGAWKDRVAYKQKYISLAMTTKNAFRQTKDHKWLQIKTVDFRQIK